MHPEMNLLIDNIRKSPTMDEMTDNCIRLIVEYGDAINIVPEYHKGLIRGCTVFEPGEERDNIFNITQSWSSIWDKSGWKHKYLFLSAQFSTYTLSQLDAIDEKMGNPRGIHAINHGLCFYELFNKMDNLFRLCGYKVKGLNINNYAKQDPKQTSFDNLIIEMKYPDCTPEYRAEVCTRLIQDYENCLDFIPVDNPNKIVKYGVKVHSKLDEKKQRVFAVCKKNDGGFAIIYSKENFQLADKNESSKAIPAFSALLDLCKEKAK